MTICTSSGQVARPLLERLDALPELKPFPAAAARLSTACQDPASNSKTLAAIIQCDASLAVRLLRVANSPLYGFSREICTVDHAVVVLGFRAVKDLAMSLAAADVFAGGDAAQDARQALWRHSLACATVAKLLAARQQGMDCEEAFLAGIVHDVGKLIFYDLVPEEYLELTAGASESTIEAEQRVFGITHPQIGRRCGEEWGLPDAINDAISRHHAPDLSAGADDLTAVVAQANRLSKRWAFGVADSSAAESDAVDDATSSDAEQGLDESQLCELREQALSAFESFQQACRL